MQTLSGSSPRSSTSYHPQQQRPGQGAQAPESPPRDAQPVLPARSLRQLLPQLSPHPHPPSMPTGRDIAARNKRNADLARAGKKVEKPSYAERNAGKSPIPPAALYLIIFVVIGGVFFELLRSFLPEPEV